MIAIDTNILPASMWVVLKTRKPPSSASLPAASSPRARTCRVLLELEWVLCAFYGFDVA